MPMRPSSRLFLVLALAFSFLPRGFAAPAPRFETDGAVVLENDLVALSLAGKHGMDHGVRSWKFKPTGFEMIDVLYGQTDYVKGHVLGERWDSVDMGSAVGGQPGLSVVYTPVRHGLAADGSAVLEQVVEGTYRFTRTAILRKDAAFLEVRYRLENVGGKPEGFSLRLHGAWSPGARGRTQSKKEDIFLPTDAGVLALDQSMGMTAFKEKYKSDRFFTRAARDLPKPEWARNPAPAAVTGNWAAQVGRENGDGMVCLISEEALAGFYICLGTTLEPMAKPVALRPGETWQATVFLGAFTGAKGKPIAKATPLYVATVPLAEKGGELAGEIIPLFAGKLRIVGAGGKVLFEAAASPDRAVALGAKGAGADWKLVALDRAGAEIGSVDAKGQAALPEPKLADTPPPRPAVAGPVYLPPQGEEAVRKFLEPRDFAIYCDWSASDLEKEAARRLSRTLGVGLTWAAPTMKVLAFGNPKTNPLIRDTGRLKRSVEPAWPGAGKGAILAWDNLELTRAPGLLVCGSDAEGALAAAKFFEEKFIKGASAPTGFALWPSKISDKVFPYTPSPRGESAPLVVRAAKGEYESAQVAITAFEDLHGVEVTLSPLVNTATGAEIDKKFLTKARQRHGPAGIRWVNLYPVNPENGWSGWPDPLLERPETEIPAGRTQALWLTFIVSENAAAGIYKATLTCKANGKERFLPIELRVWDFTLPPTGLPGDPYISLHNLAPDNKRELTKRQLAAFTENMVEHGMRFIHFSQPGLFRWHFSASGEFKGLKADWLEVSEDGTLALDTTAFDAAVETIDAAAKPFEIRYMVYQHCALDYPRGVSTFKKLMPNRFEGRPKREGSENAQGYHVEEMMKVYKRHLERRGWLNRCTFKIGDEPPSFDWWWNNATVAARNVGLPIVTAFNQLDPAEAEKGVGKVAQWQVIYMKDAPDLLRKAHAAGDLVGWYNCGPPPRIAVSAPASEIRGYLWQAAKADLDFICWWGIQNWESHHDTWNNRFAHWNFVTYPPHPKKPAWNKPGKGLVDQVILDSIRWELIREGLEDAGYVKLLREEIAAVRKGGRAAEADKAQAVLDTIWKEVFPTLNDYAPAWERMEECRRQVAEAILALKGKPPVK